MGTFNNDTRINYRSALTITALFLLISVICLIINYSIDHSINWSLYPIGGLIVIWASLIPLLILEKNKAVGTFLGLTITLIPFIYLIQDQSSVNGWFFPLALPIVTLSLLAFGISLLAFASKKLNNFISFALTVFLFGVIVNIGVGYTVNHYLKQDNVFDIYRVSTISVSVFLSLILVVIGYTKRKETN